MRHPRIAGLVFGVILATAACSSAAATPTPPPAVAPSVPAAGAVSAVGIANFSFTPATITVAVGTTVTWANADTTGHTVTADDGSFKSDTLAPGATFNHTFATAGTFTYHCAIHSSMKGTVTVH